MPCQPYKDALIEAAASGAEPQGELHAHFDVCASCREAYEQEQSLFASIDVGLQRSANAAAPASLLPRVRACLDTESTPSRIWVTNWLVLASAAVIVVAFLAVRAVWRTNVVQRPVETAEKTNVPPPQKLDPVVALSVEKSSGSQPQLTIIRNPSAHETLVAAKSKRDVIVPGDQEVLLAEYAEQWSLHKRAPLLAQDSDATVLVPLQVAQIQIPELDVKLLAEEKSQ